MADPVFCHFLHDSRIRHIQHIDRAAFGGQRGQLAQRGHIQTQQSHLRALRNQLTRQRLTQAAAGACQHGIAKEGGWGVGLAVHGGCEVCDVDGGCCFRGRVCTL